MKYIDAEKLKKSIGNYLEGARAALNPTDGDADYYKGKIDACKDMQELVTSLQQEQPEVQNGKFVFPKYLYARTKDNKTIDMSYAPQDMTAVEYIRNDIVEQAQPENKEKIMNFFDAVGNCGFSQHDILQLKNIWKETECPPPKPQVADASKMEQPEVDLEKEIEEQINMYYNECEKKLNQMSDDDTDIGFLTLNNFARHFYELGFYARKK